MSLLFLLLLLGDNPSMQDAMPILNIVTALTNSYANTHRTQSIAWVVTVLDYRAHKQLVGSNLLCGCSTLHHVPRLYP